MRVTLFGLIIVAIGLWAVFGSVKVPIRAMTLLTLFGAAAAVSLPALGGASILPASLFTAFALGRALLSPGGGARALQAVSPGSPGMWLMLAIAYGVLCTFLIAPNFYGAIFVAPIARSADGSALFRISPLEFRSGNITQTVYAIGQVCLYAAMFSIVSTLKRRQMALQALVILAFAHIFVSLMDLATFAANAAYLMTWMRSAAYTQWSGSSLAGFKRLSGSFSESSTYSIYAMAIAGVLYSLYLSGYRRRLTRPALITVVVLLLISTSTTAYVALSIAMALILLSSIKDLVVAGRFDALRFIAISLIAAAGAVLFIVVVFPSAVTMVQDLFNQAVLNKLDTESAADRSNLNIYAWASVFSSFGLGVGLGGARTSSFLVALISNLGVIGTAFYLMFLGSMFLASKNRVWDPDTATLYRACKAGMTGSLVGASVSLQVFDLGPLFYLLAALASACLAASPARGSVRIARPDRRDVRLVSGTVDAQ